MANVHESTVSLRRMSGNTRSPVEWKTARFVVVLFLVFFAASRVLFFLHENHILSHQYNLTKGEDEKAHRVMQLQSVSVIGATNAALSGSHIAHDEQSEEAVIDIEEKSLTEDVESTTVNSGQAPKLALMFLVKDEIHNEPIWRQFLDNAKRLKFKSKVPKTVEIDLREELQRELYPPIHSLEDSRYPGYKIQHGMVPPSKYRSTSYPHVKRRLLQEENTEQTTNKQVPVEAEMTGVDVGYTQEEWRNASNLGCLGEQHLLQKQANALLNDTRIGHEIYSKQDLFSIYVHASPGFKFSSTSLFFGLEIEDPVNCTNGFALHTLIEAELRLLKAALQEQRNFKFVLLSEACAPIHPPEVIYAQAMHETKSRINACLTKQNYGRLETWRWKTKMETKFLTKNVWRKSQQWFILNRFHVELAVKDHHIKEVFKRYCWSYGKHICVSDEHYLPTLLASYGLDDQTDCLGEGTWTNWSSSGWHPKTFEAEEVSPALLKIIQNKAWPPCDPNPARKTALKLFELPKEKESVHLEESCLDEDLSLPSDDWIVDLAQASSEDWIVKGGYIPLGYECPLFARKFSPEALPATINATLSCSGAALGPWCAHATLTKT